MNSLRLHIVSTPGAWGHVQEWFIERRVSDGVALMFTRVLEDGVSAGDDEIFLEEGDLQPHPDQDACRQLFQYVENLEVPLVINSDLLLDAGNLSLAVETRANSVTISSLSAVLYMDDPDPRLVKLVQLINAAIRFDDSSS